MRCLMPALVFVLCGLTPVAAATVRPAGDAGNGERLFMRDGCYACHGTRGAGGGIAGPSLVPNLPPFEAVLMQLRTPASRMPPYTDKVLSDAEAEDIYAYLTSVPAGRQAGQIPLLNLNPAPKRTSSGGGSHHARHSAVHVE